MTRILIALLFLTGVLAQNSTLKKTKEEGFVIAPMVFKDAPCARDYVKAKTAGGLEGRKTLAELAQYGCLQIMDGIYHVEVTDTKPITTGPKPSVAKYVLMILDIENTSKLNHRAVDAATTFADGWVLAESILHVTDQEMDDLVAKRISQKQSQ